MSNRLLGISAPPLRLITSALLTISFASLWCPAQTSLMRVIDDSDPAEALTGLSSHVESEIGVVIDEVPSPRLVHFAPEATQTNSGAVIVIPGGGYAVEAYDLEGVHIARELAAAGYNAFVLQYRLPVHTDEMGTKSHDDASYVPLADAQSAVRRARALADSLGYAANKIAVMGFSAGGHLAGSVAVHEVPTPLTTYSSRPDRSILVYAVTKMDEEASGHRGSQDNLLGPTSSNATREYFDLPGRVDANTPPTLLVHASDDEIVPVDNAIAYYRALLAAGVLADLRVYATGGHGFGTARERDAPLNIWLDEALTWLRSSGW